IGWHKQVPGDLAHCGQHASVVNSAPLDLLVDESLSCLPIFVRRRADRLRTLLKREMCAREKGTENRYQGCRVEPQPESFPRPGTKGTRQGSPVAQFPLPPVSLKPLWLHGWNSSSFQCPSR
ncbi:MAG TPA: hypothetical protein VEN79_03085, partial [Terriglobia bacterium]|nr:hypothetical protein [Terriglobia bacterium]